MCFPISSPPGLEGVAELSVANGTISLEMARRVGDGMKENFRDVHKYQHYSFSREEEPTSTEIILFERATGYSS